MKVRPKHVDTDKPTGYTKLKLRRWLRRMMKRLMKYTPGEDDDAQA